MNRTHTQDLFRKQAIKSLSKKEPGRPIGSVPRPWYWLNGLIAVLFLSTAFFIASAEYSRKELVRGWLVSSSGIVKVASSTVAIVSDVSRMPGERVTAGEPLVYLSTQPTLANGHGKSEQVLTQLRAEIQEINSQLKLSREQQAMEMATLARQRQAVDRGAKALFLRLDEQRYRIELARDKQRRVEGALKSGAVTQWDVIRERENVAALQQGFAELEQDIARGQHERELLVGQQGSLIGQAKIQRSVLRMHRLQLSQEIAEHESQRLSVLLAPVNGTVATVEVHAGDSIASRQLLMTVLPEGMRLVAELYLPSRAAGFIRPGQAVDISYDAFPRQKFGTFKGQIEHVSSFVLLPGEIPQPFPIPEAVYKVQVKIDDAAINTSIGTAGLRPGMLLAAEIVLERRNLIDWFLEPLRFRRSVSG